MWFHNDVIIIETARQKRTALQQEAACSRVAASIYPSWSARTMSQLGRLMVIVGEELQRRHTRAAEGMHTQFQSGGYSSCSTKGVIHDVIADSLSL